MFDGVVVVKFEDAVVGSCMKKTTTMFAAQVVFYNTLFDGVVIVEFEDAVVGSYTKKTTVRETEGVGSDYDVKQRKGSNRVNVLRKKGWPTVIAGAIEKIDGKGSDLKKRAVTKICRLSAGSSRNVCGAGDPGCQGCRSVGGVRDRGGGRGGSRGGRFHWRMCRRQLLSLSVGFQEIYSNEKEKVATLAVRSCLATAAS
ncbi:hypothetical protein BHE74_00020550 [Ensete ventricosum]|nr:hypothetical protein BHE74_00020550 [Ensete ventricosum]